MLIPRTFSEMIQYFKDQVSVMNIPMKYRVDLLGMISAIETRHERDMPKWIPCSERLPKEDGQYLITVKYVHSDDSYEDVYAEHGEWYDGRWDMFCFGHCGKVEDIIAWMELPKPWEGDANGKER